MASWKDGLKPETIATVETFFDGSGIAPDEFTVTEEPDGRILIHRSGDRLPVQAAG